MGLSRIETIGYNSGTLQTGGYRRRTGERGSERETKKEKINKSHSYYTSIHFMMTQHLYISIRSSNSISIFFYYINSSRDSSFASQVLAFFFFVLILIIFKVLVFLPSQNHAAYYDIRIAPKYRKRKRIDFVIRRREAWRKRRISS